MNDNFNEVPNRFFDLYTETYTSMLNAWLWGTQRALEFNKVIVNQFETNQAEGRRYVEDLNNKARQGSQIFQEVWQESIKTYSANVNTFRNASETAVNDLNRKFEQLQQRMEVSAN